MLQCPICYERFENPIVQCTSGHSFCQKCIHVWLQKKKVCPLDNYYLDKQRLIRNLALEEVNNEFDKLKERNPSSPHQPHARKEKKKSKTHLQDQHLAVLAVMVFMRCLYLYLHQQRSFITSYFSFIIIPLTSSPR